MTPGIKQQSSGIAADLKGSNKDMDGILRDLKSGKLHKEDLKVGLPVLKNQAEVYQKLSENPDTPSELKPLYAEAASKINEVIAAINTP